MRPRIRIEIVPNENVRIYYTTLRMSNFTVCSFRAPFYEDILDRKFTKMGNNGREFLRDLFSIPNVVEIYIEPFQFIITKSAAVGWENVEPQVLESFKERFLEDGGDVEIIYTFLEIPEQIKNRKDNF